jgi:hypothetical protein
MIHSRKEKAIMALIWLQRWTDPSPPGSEFNINIESQVRRNAPTKDTDVDNEVAGEWLYNSKVIFRDQVYNSVVHPSSVRSG